MKPLINTGLIGFGMAGRIFLAPLLSQHNGYQLTAISSSNPEAVANAGKLYRGAKLVPGAEAILQDPAIELVVIATPNTSHLALAKQAMEAGKHVIVEKPFTISSTDAEELIAISRKTGKVLTVHHNRRFDGDYATVKKLLASGILGELAEMKIHYDRFRPVLRPNAWREADLPGSGILYDLGAHLIDQALDLFGMPQTLQAEMLVQRPGGKVDDRFELVLGYPGLRVCLSAGMLVKDPGPHFMLYGNKGSFVKSGMDPQENALKAGFTPQTLADWGKEPASASGKLTTEWQGIEMVSQVESEVGRYPDFFKNVAAAIRDGAVLEVKPEQAKNTIKIIELALQSAKEKRTLSLA